MTRESTNAVLEALQQGLLTGEAVAEMCLSYMSEDDVADMLRVNDIDLGMNDDVVDDEEDEPDLEDIIDEVIDYIVDDMMHEVNYPGHPSHY